MDLSLGSHQYQIFILCSEEQNSIRKRTYIAEEKGKEDF